MCRIADVYMQTTFNKKIKLLAETSWEVCNKVGGIYTVLSTKAAELQKAFGDRLLFIGPDIWNDENKAPDFTERKTMLGNASSIEFPYGIKIRCGRWKVPGSPQAVLVDYKGIFPCLNEIYGRMWRLYGVDSLHSYGDYDESCAFAVASAIVIKTLAAHLDIDQSSIVAHFDEWTTGMGLLCLKADMPQAATIFTTHATTVGRSICSNGKPLYEYFNAYDGDQMARELNVESKHSLEKAAAANADCFTTVSEVTARECRQLLGVSPAVVTPNGFEPSFVPTDRRWVRLRNKGRKRLLEIASRLHNMEYRDNTFILATSGRNEYRNKGLDLFIDSAWRLGEKLAVSRRKVLAFIFVPSWVKEVNSSLLMDMKFRSSAGSAPDYMTHIIHNEDTDAIACSIRAHKHRREEEGAESNVRYIYVPCYLDGGDGIVNMNYYDLLPAVDASLFGSYYEPWGYTPLESVAFGVPTVTTDKAGFGQWVADNFTPEFDACGVKVVCRTDSNYSDNVEEISNCLSAYMNASADEVSDIRKAARATAESACWKFFIKEYYKAFGVAMESSGKRNKRRPGRPKKNTRP